MKTQTSYEQMRFAPSQMEQQLAHLKSVADNYRQLHNNLVTRIWEIDREISKIQTQERARASRFTFDSQKTIAKLQDRRAVLSACIMRNQSAELLSATQIEIARLERLLGREVTVLSPSFRNI